MRARVLPGKWGYAPVLTEHVVEVEPTSVEPHYGAVTAYTVWLDDVEVGVVFTRIVTPRVQAWKGSRLGRDLAPRREWFYRSADGRHETPPRLGKDRRSDAVVRLLEVMSR